MKNIEFEYDLLEFFYYLLIEIISLKVYNNNR